MVVMFCRHIRFERGVFWRDRDRHFSSMLRSNSVMTHQLDNIPMMYLSSICT
jgi:hypothetical protein